MAKIAGPPPRRFVEGGFAGGALGFVLGGVGAGNRGQPAPPGNLRRTIIYQAVRMLLIFPREAITASPHPTNVNRQLGMRDRQFLWHFAILRPEFYLEVLIWPTRREAIESSDE